MTTHVLDGRDRAVHRPVTLTTVAGLAIGAVLGMAGNFVTPGPVQDLLFVVSALGLIVAAALLATRHAVGGLPLAAAGFALLALAEARLLGPTAAPGGDGIFAGTTLLYCPALVVIALSGWAPLWVRVVGAVAALPFLAHSLVFFAGGTIDHSGPLAGAGYALLTVTIVGWILTLLREQRAA